MLNAYNCIRYMSAMNHVLPRYFVRMCVCECFLVVSFSHIMHDDRRRRWRWNAENFTVAKEDRVPRRSSVRFRVYRGIDKLIVLRWRLGAFHVCNVWFIYLGLEIMCVDNGGA